MPRCTNVVVNPRAPESSTGTLRVERRDELPGFGVVATRLPFCVFPCRQVVPARTPGCLGVRRDDGNARFHQIVPIPNALWVAARTRKTIVDV